MVKNSALSAKKWEVQLLDSVLLPYERRYCAAGDGKGLLNCRVAGRGSRLICMVVYVITPLLAQDG